ncbi:MAG: hypothetical protein K9H26_17450 [Prolixibacteraceae bacterium]|nr:hypothetical protein [Prolixibacteraceae bacterium]
MKKIILSIILLISLSNITRSQTVILDMNDVYGTDNCNKWCWNRAATNMIDYYYGYHPSKIEIAEIARENGLLQDFCECTTCTSIPDSCCKTIGSVASLLVHWGFKFYPLGVATASEFAEVFSVNKPVIIMVNKDYSGHHYFIAHGIEGSDVHIIDGWLGETQRSINDIYPNSTWSSTDVPKFSPDCSDVNEVTARITNSKTYYSKNTMKISGNFQNNTNSVFRSDNEVILEYKMINASIPVGFKVNLGSSLVIYTGENNCP